MYSNGHNIRKNPAATSAGADRLEKLLRKAELIEPIQGPAPADQRVKGKLGYLRSCAEKAESLIINAEAREKNGELDERAFLAESIGPRLVASLYESFSEIYDRAEKRGAASAMNKLSRAVSMLLGSIESDALLTQDQYPQSEPDANSARINRKISCAREAYSDVLDALNGYHAILGVDLPRIREL